MTGDPTVAMIELRLTVLQDIADDGHLLVANDDGGSAQLSEIGPDGGWRRLTDLEEPVTGRYLPGFPRRVVITVNPGGTERTQLSLLEVPADAINGVPGLHPLVHHPDFIHQLVDVGDDWIVYLTNRRDGVEFDIIRRVVSTGEEHVLYDGGGSFGEVSVDDSGTRLVASRMTLVAASSQLLLIDADSGAVREITDAARPGDWEGATWLPDGELIASAASSERVEVQRWSAETGEWRIELADPGADLIALPSPDGDRWAVVRSEDGADSISVRDRSGDVTPIELPGRGIVTGYNPIRWSADGTQLGFTFSSPATPPEAYSWSAAMGTRRRTTSNTAGLPDLRPLQSHQVSTPDGEHVPVFVVRGQPAVGSAADGSAVIYIHGGPEAQAMQSWSPYIAALALAGHTVVVPNVRGSAGYGRRWLALDDIEKRLDSVADLAAIHAWLPEIDVDPGRVALMGGSYGGYMVLAGLTFHAGLWAAGVDIVGMSSLTTFMENTSAYRRAYREREYGSLADHRDVLEAASPLPIIDRLSVPLFVIHGRNDPRVPLGEAEQVATAVRANGAECELLVYDDEGHGLAKRKNRLDAYPRAAAFLARHLG